LPAARNPQSRHSLREKIENKKNESLPIWNEFLNYRQKNFLIFLFLKIEKWIKRSRPLQDPYFVGGGHVRDEILTPILARHCVMATHFLQ
jgi:hypothetical protein